MQNDHGVANFGNNYQIMLLIITLILHLTPNQLTHDDLLNDKIRIKSLSIC